MFFRSLLVTCTLLLASPSPAQDCIQYSDYMRWVGGVSIPPATQWGAVATGVATNQDYALVADIDAGLVLVDISKPDSPQVVEVFFSPLHVYDVEISGSQAFVVENFVFYVMEISSPGEEALTLLGSVTIRGAGRAVAVSGSYAYIANRLLGLQIIDISDPQHPLLAGSVETPGSPNGVSVSGQYVLVAAEEGGLVVIDASDPTNPQVVGTMDTPNNALKVAHFGTQAYLCDSGAFLCVDISNPQNPQIVGSVTTPGAAVDLEIVGNLAYVADHGNGLKIIDVSFPDSPQIQASIGVPSSHCVSIQGNHVYSVGSRFEAIEIQNALSPQVLGNVDTPGYGRDIVISGTHGFVADDDEGLQIIDLSNPLQPEIVGTLETPSSAHKLAIWENLALIASYSAGLVMVDISTPSAPLLFGVVNIPGYAIDVAIEDNLAFVAAGSGGLQIIDLSNPEFPAVVGQAGNLGYARAVVISEPYAFVAGGLYGDAYMAVINISNPENPHRVATLDTPGDAHGLFLVDGLVYIADAAGGLHVVDASIPQYPEIVCSLQTAGIASSGEVSGSIAYVAVATAGVQIFDVSNPYSPQMLGVIDPPGTVRAVAIAENFACAASWTAGVQIIPVNCDNSVSIDAPDNDSVSPDSPLESAPFSVYPNPFNPITRATFSIDHPQMVALSIFDVSGKRIKHLARRFFPAGSHSFEWDGQDSLGNESPSGTYLLRLESEDGVQVAKMTLLR